uniref:Secreted protein n=1 Tax=Steinernema glaseri TaxID=37863 RepID=A0A1I8A1E5_9BILA
MPKGRLQRALQVQFVFPYMRTAHSLLFINVGTEAHVWEEKETNCRRLQHVAGAHNRWLSNSLLKPTTSTGATIDEPLQS